MKGRNIVDRKTWRYGVVAAVLMVASSPCWAAATIDVNEDVSITIGGRLQTLAIFSEEDLDGDGSFDSTEDFKLRRGRLKISADITQWVSGFFQTEVGSEADGGGRDARVIDAFVTLKPSPWAHVVMGEHMAPASRQNVTTSAALMAIDRPGINYKTLTWGTRSVGRFATSTIADADAGLRGDVDVRDTGATLFGSRTLRDEELHLKYYLGVYDGVQASTTDSERFTGRIQFNLFDAEPAYFNHSTYLGKKKTVGLGAAYDMQDEVGECETKGPFDYRFYTADLFIEWPVGPGAISFEAAYEDLDLDDAQAFDVDGDSETPGIDTRQSQGDGYYVQAGYTIDKWQPWVEWEFWDSDHEAGKGSYDMYRVGVTYYILGQQANIKAGFEQVRADAPLKDSNEDTIDTAVVGVYLNY